MLAQNECIARWESERAGPLLRLPPAGSGSEEESGEEGGEEGGEESDEESGFMGRWTHTPKGQAWLGLGLGLGLGLDPNPNQAAPARPVGPGSG